LRLLFLWYSKLYIIITHAVSRRQEFAADELAARLVGSRPLTEGLKLIAGATFALEMYWSDEVVPLLRKNRYPSSIAEAFRCYLASPQITEMVSEYIQYELAEGQTDPYDTHPPLRERITALQRWPQGEIVEHDLPAITLVENVKGIETQVIRSIPRSVMGPG